MTASPTRYRLIGPDGKVATDRDGRIVTFHRVALAGAIAAKLWPGVPQRESQESTGWDVEPADATS